VLREKTKQKIFDVQKYLTDGYSVRQSLKLARLGYSSYKKYRDLIFTPQVLKYLEVNRELYIAMSNPPYYFEFYPAEVREVLERRAEGFRKRFLEQREAEFERLRAERRARKAEELARLEAWRKWQLHPLKGEKLRKYIEKLKKLLRERLQSQSW